MKKGGKYKHVNNYGTNAHCGRGIECGIFADAEIVFCNLIGALPLGLVIAFGSMTRFLPVRWLSRTLVWVIRGRPL